MKLTECKNKDYHYFEDEQGRLQGEYKAYRTNGTLIRKGFYKDDKPHGKYTYYYENGSIEEIKYYSMGKNITKKMEKINAILKL